MAKGNKVIHIIIGQFPEYSAISLRIKQTQELGAKAEIWDLAEMVGLPPTNHLWNQERITSIKNKKQLFDLINTNQKALFVTAINPERRFFWVYRYLAKFHCKHAKVANGWIVEYGTSKFIFATKIRRAIKKIFLSLLDKINLISLPKIIFLPGYYWNSKIPGNPKIININHLLYDQFLEEKDSYQQNKEKYILFLDEAHPYHPDWKICNTKPMDEQKYYLKMKVFFDKFEEKFNLPIIIAAHPKARYSGNEFGSGKFGPRKIFQGQTNELASQAEVFLAHISTTRLLPIFYYKPLYLLWLNEFSKYPLCIQNDFYGISREIDCSIITEHDIQHGFQPISPNIEKYKNYLYKYYITDKYEKINTLDIIGKELIKLSKED